MLLAIEIILAAGIIVGALYLFHQFDVLDEMEDDLYKYSVHLDERANKLSAEEATTIELNRQLRDALKKYGKEEEH